MNEIIDEVPRYRKRSQKKPPKKSDHKHVFEPCVVEYPQDWYVKEHLRSGEKKAAISSYCPICGKIGSIDIERWWTRETIMFGNYACFQSIPTEEAELELNPETRTLPTFTCDNFFQKFVDIEGVN